MNDRAVHYVQREADFAEILYRSKAKYPVSKDV